MQKKTLKHSGRPAFGRAELRSPILVMIPETFEPLPPEFEALVGRRPDLQRLRFWTVCDLGSADVEATLLAAAFVVRGGHLSKWRKGGRAGTHDRFIKVASKDSGAAGAVLLWESKPWLESGGRREGGIHLISYLFTVLLPCLQSPVSQKESSRESDGGGP